MSVQYFIDGYNLLHSTDRWDEIPWLNRRSHLLSYLEEERPTGSLKNSVTVVFDGHVPRSGPERTKTLRVIFSGDRDADSVIKELIDQLPNPRGSVVISNDRSIQLHVKKRGAKVISCEEFFSMGKRKPALRRGRGMDPEAAGEINEEMKRVWKLK